jgi:hypothetical protein
MSKRLLGLLRLAPGKLEREIIELDSSLAVFQDDGELILILACLPDRARLVFLPFSSRIELPPGKARPMAAPKGDAKAGSLIAGQGSP